MRDYNFFEDYKVQKVQRDSRVVVGIVVMLVVFAALAGFSTFNLWRMNTIQEEINAISEEITELKEDDDVARVRSKVQLSEELKDVVINVDAASKSVMERAYIDENLLAIVTDAVPQDVELNSISVSDGRINVNGIGLSRPAIAEFQHNFMDSDVITEIFIPSITGEEGNYSFSATLTIGGVADENIN